VTPRGLRAIPESPPAILEAARRGPLLGVATPRGVGKRPRMSPSAAAAFATFVDPARARAAMEGRTLVYTVRWS
jgi:hypothetical protein